MNLCDRIHGVTLSMHTSAEIRSLAIKRITNSTTYDKLLHPNVNGLYDRKLGPNDINDICDTCGMNGMKCPGHFGYIELPSPVYHPMFFKLMMQIISGSCFHCHRLTAKSSRSHLFKRQYELLDKGCYTEATNLRDRYGSFAAECSEGSTSETSKEEGICDKIDAYYTEVCKQKDSDLECSKNLMNSKQSLVNEFMKVHLKCKAKECPHCKSLLRDLRSEYNVRVYFKAASRKDVKKAVVEKTVHGLKTPPQPVKDKRLPMTQEDEVDQDELLDQPIENEGSNEIFEDPDDDNDGDDDDKEASLKKKLSNQEYITPYEIKEHMIQLWNKEGELLKYLLGSYNEPERRKRVSTPEMFFLDAVAVPPSKFRPLSYLGEKRFENPQTSNLNKVLLYSRLVEEILRRISEDSTPDTFEPVALLQDTNGQQDKSLTVPGKSYTEQLQNAWIEMQNSVNTYMDNSLNKLAPTGVPGIRQLLEKKEGLFRKHMMGKRVNHACRSVISPDPYINTNEIGVPLVFASKLTYVQPVTAWNVEKLAQMVINGPNKYPGAVMVEDEDGRKTKLSAVKNERNAIAKRLLSSEGKKVHRNLVNGDVLLMNRQPSLHKASIMAHKARVLTNERTLRLHYANCNSYNADFDGDEMNAHFPQTELGRAEALHLSSTNFNYLGPKDGKPLAGLIQDHVVSGVRMTTRSTFFNKEEYQQLVFSALIDVCGYVKVLPPCIMKPKPLWSGKQVFSTVLLNIIPDDKILLNMDGKSRVSDSTWPKGKGRRTDNYHNIYANDKWLTESHVIVRNGELLTGILDKSQYGAVPFSIIHCVYELYGGEISGKLLSTLGRLFTAFLQQQHGFTLGIEDILVLPGSEAKRRSIIKEGRLCGDESAIEALHVTCDKATLTEKLQEAHHTNQGFALQHLDLSMKSRTDKINNKVNKVCIDGLLKKFPSNALQLMALTGAKGSSVNCMQISCLLGQIELEGRRPPLSMSGRSLPSFMPYDTSPGAGGFVDSRFLTGIKPREYFFHCMAGREGLIDTAVKTSRSGYLQRCLIKHLEALYVHYDMTVRDCDGSVVQFLYGDDGMDVLKSQYMQRSQFKSIAENYEAYLELLKPTEVSKVVELEKAPKLQRKIDRWKRRNKRQSNSNDFPDQSTQKRHGISEEELKLMLQCDGPTKESYASKCLPCPDPVLSKFHPACHYGAVSEKFKDEVNDYSKSNPDGLLSDREKDNFVPLMLIKFIRSLISPGEPVGVLAGQSIGEPSTQMTLNTFHFAGRGEMNVTLGIPRLREILMTASTNIKTPQMDILVKAGQEDNAKSLARTMNKVTLMQVLHHIEVSESLQTYQDNCTTRCRQYKVRLEFLPHAAYHEDYVVTPDEIMSFVEVTFIKSIATAVVKIIRTKEKLSLLDTQKDDTLRRAPRVAEQNDEVAPDEPDDQADLSDEDLGDDGGVMDVKDRQRKTQFSSYDDPDGQEEEEREGDHSFERIPIEGEPIDYDDNSFSNDDVDAFSQVEKKVKVEQNIPVPEDPRVFDVLNRVHQLKKYVVDVNNLWCELTLQFPLAGSKVMLLSIIEKLAEKAVVHEFPGITKAMTTDCKEANEIGRKRLKTEGLNIPELRKYSKILDINSIYCNNIHSVAEHYGIEAARKVLIKEVQNVFGAYGIYINPRHLSLVADYMTFEGTYKPFNRIAIESCASPFQKISFETGMSFLRSATAFGQPDELGSPSSRIIVGQEIGQGTGLMGLVPKLSI